MDFLKQRALYIAVTVIVLLVGLVLVLSTMHSPQQVGTSMVAAGIVSLLFLWEQWAREGADTRRATLDRARLDTIHERRNLDGYHLAVDGLSHRLDVTGYSLRSFYESFAATIALKAQGQTRPNVRILLVDHRCEASKAQEQAEGAPTGSFADHVQRVIKWSRDVAGVEVRLLDRALATMVFRIDDTMYVGPYFAARSSAATVTYELKSGGWLFNQYSEEFEAMWKAAALVK